MKRWYLAFIGTTVLTIEAHSAAEARKKILEDYKKRGELPSALVVRRASIADVGWLADAGVNETVTDSLKAGRF